MKAIVKPFGEVGLKLVADAPCPTAGPDEVLVRVLAASICGSDLHIYDNDPVFRDRISDQQIVGHEFCGVVAAIGAHVTGVAVGDTVAAESHVVCGSCYYCLNQLSHICRNIATIGFDRAGGFAEYVAIPARNAVRKPPGISVEVAALLEPFGNALDTATCFDLVGRSILVTGCGPQGLMAIEVAKAAGARRVIATEVHAGRRTFAQEIIAAQSDPRREAEDLVLDSSDPDLAGRIFAATGGLGVDVVLEMSGHPQAIADGLAVLKNGGHVVALGLPSRLVQIDWARHLVLRGATFHGIYGRRLFQTWFKAFELLESRAVRLERLITHRFPLERYEEAFGLLKQGQAAKIILYPNAVI
jgi:threonine 3-dehydrogenase